MCFPGGWGKESQLTGKSEVKGCSSPSHTWHGGGPPFAVSTQDKEWARHAGHCVVRGLSGGGFAVLAWEAGLPCSVSYVVLGGLAGQADSAQPQQNASYPMLGRRQSES